MKSLHAVPHARLSLLALCAALTACSSLDGGLGDDKVDYRGGAAVKSRVLDVPPDLSQLSRDSRYQIQGGVVSAAAAGSARPTGAETPAAVPRQDKFRVERAGQQRWLVAEMPPEQVWPQVRSFWEQRGFTLEVDDAAAGLMETNWAENRAKLPVDALRNTLGRLIGNLFDTGERDRYRTRIERTATGSEIYITHRGVEEFHTDAARDTTGWRARGNDPELEAAMLARLMVSLGAKDLPAATKTVASAPEQPGRARRLTEGAALEVDEPFDRAWRRVGLALDRGGFTVEDRDRAGGLYYVRYVDPKSAGKDEPGFWARLMGEANPAAAVRYRIAVKADGSKTRVSVLNATGGADAGENGQRIAAQLVTELR